MKVQTAFILILGVCFLSSCASRTTSEVMTLKEYEASQQKQASQTPPTPQQPAPQPQPQPQREQAQKSRMPSDKEIVTQNIDWKLSNNPNMSYKDLVNINYLLDALQQVKADPSLEIIIQVIKKDGS